MLYCSMQFFQAHEQIVFKEKKKKGAAERLHGDPNGSVYDGGEDLAPLFMAH